MNTAHKRKASEIAGTVLLFSLLAGAIGACRRSAEDPVTLSYFRLGWAQPDELPTAEPLSQQFIRETGIQLRNVPVPETTLDQLNLSRRLLEGGSGLDVLGVDLIWSGVLASDLLDLRGSLSAEIAPIDTNLLHSYVVDGRLVAIPYAVQTGALEYRSDLLREYGYDHPPGTWDELEVMAEKIQKGERAKGKKDFWGYVWQGAAAEALTCNALEWQASEGGGHIIEDDRTISVNNRAAIRSWQRAKHWIGWISPPGVLDYQELDSINAFDSGRAAFNRVWSGTTVTAVAQTKLFHRRTALPADKTSYSRIPGGAAGSAGTLGGSGLAVSRNSLHSQEAIALLRFLIRAQIKTNLEEDKASAALHGNEESPGTSRATNGQQSSSQYQNGIVVRPSSIVGAKYEQVAKAYISAVHAVLAGDKAAPQAAAELEQELIKMTGFAPGPPKRAQ